MTRTIVWKTYCADVSHPSIIPTTMNHTTGSTVSVSTKTSSMIPRISPFSNQSRPKSRQRRQQQRNQQQSSEPELIHGPMQWGYRIQQLEQFRTKYGHCHVTAQHDKDVSFPGLYQWTRTIRSRYRHQYQSLKMITTTNNTMDATTTNTSTNHNNTHCIDNKNNTPTKKSDKNKLYLSEQHYHQLTYEFNFVWDPQQDAWDRRFQQLQNFYQHYRHCRVPNNSLQYPGLGIWVRNQRREYAKYMQQQQQQRQSSSDNATKITKSSTLTIQRQQALQALDFEWYRSHQDAWMTQYQRLVQFYNQYGHSNVPQPQRRYEKRKMDDHTNTNDKRTKDVVAIEDASVTLEQLGYWCMNQRTAYRNYCNIHNNTNDNNTKNNDNMMNGISPTALTKERIELLEQVQFCWNTRQSRWYGMLNRLYCYYQQNGHINIVIHDEKNQDLRLWLIWQRYLYNNRYRTTTNTTNINNSSTNSSSMDWKWYTLRQERIDAMEAAIPNFRWKARSMENGPSNEDWSKLFDALRERGLEPGMRPKQHWFEGLNPLSMSVKNTYTEQDLLELWNQEEVEDDDEI